MARDCSRSVQALVFCHVLVLLLGRQCGSLGQGRSRSPGAPPKPPSRAKAKPGAAPRPGSEAESAWMRMRASNATRPYSLPLTKEHYHYSPSPPHLDRQQLRKLLGPSFDPFWMSVRGRRSNESREDLTLLSRELAAGSLRYRRKLWQEARRLDPDVAGAAGTRDKAAAGAGMRWRRWLVQEATCPLASRWVDLGTVFWPRWVRHTDCHNGKASCSWPAGMSCTQAQWTHIKLLVWHCWTAKERGATLQHCTWRQTPYPVVTACKCSCR
uniref:noggin-like n=1 Tax=Pristiophorus japonicus TaxID=55135 RepID=UPI00398F6F93